MKTNMNWVPYASTVALAFGATLAPMTVHSKIYVSIEQAQQLIFGAEHLTLQPIVLTRETQEKMRQASPPWHIHSSPGASGARQPGAGSSSMPKVSC